MSCDTVTLAPVAELPSVHKDDVHGLIALGPNKFVSGSKDRTAKIWAKSEGKFQQVLVQCGSQERDYKRWVTALSSLPATGEGTWAAGYRDGVVRIFDGVGKELKRISLPLAATGDPRCKERNQNRIMCIFALSADLLVVGLPKFLQLWHLDSPQNEPQIVAQYKAHSNDWVYCVEVISERKWLVVIGSEMELWQFPPDQWLEPARSKVIEDRRGKRQNKQRPLISAVTRLDGRKHQVAIAVFDGTVRIVDFEAVQTVCTFQHSDNELSRVWSVVNLRRDMIASSGCDGTIKIWHLGQCALLRTIAGNPGRVSSLLKLDADTLISASCHDDPRESNGASLRFWHIPQLLSA